MSPYFMRGCIATAAGIRSFTLLNHLDEKLWPSTGSLLAVHGLRCEPCSARFDYELEVDVPSAVVDLYKRKQRQDPLRGLGVWSVGAPRPQIPISHLGAALGYPGCCEDMDAQTKAHDHSVTLTQLWEDSGGKLSAAKIALNAGKLSSAWTAESEEWSKRLDLTRERFPFAVHTACDACLKLGSESPSGKLSILYEGLTVDVSPELHLMVRWACEVCRIALNSNRART
jgi:hypothetical protein